MFKSFISKIFGSQDTDLSSPQKAKPGHQRQVPDYLRRTREKLIDLREIGGFGKLAQESIEANYTNHYYDRLFAIYQGIVNVKRNVKDCRSVLLAEVGVFRGGTARFAINCLKELGISDFQMHLFDTFEGHASKDINSQYDRTDTHTPGLFGKTSLEGVKAALGDLSGVHFHKGRFADTCGVIEEKVFDYVHLDVDLYEPLVHALAFFADKVSVGGWLIVDDYGFLTCPGAKLAVDDFLAQHKNFTSLILLSGQCVLIRV